MPAVRKTVANSGPNAGKEYYRLWGDGSKGCTHATGITWVASQLIVLCVLLAASAFQVPWASVFGILRALANARC